MSHFLIGRFPSAVSLVVDNMLVVVSLLLFLFPASLLAETPPVVYAVNCGGSRHYDSKLKVTYQQDRLFSGGIASPDGKKYSPFPLIHDDTVYQTERYNLGDFDYRIPVEEEGEYTLVLKFSEVYFSRPGEKVFDVYIAGEAIVRSLDIFSLVGRGIPLDTYTPFSLEAGSLFVKGEPANEAWDAEKREMTVSFVQLRGKDNPKVNAIVVYKGSPEDVPKLRTMEEERKLKEREKKKRQVKKTEEEDDIMEAVIDSHETETEDSEGDWSFQPDLLEEQDTHSILFFVVLACTALVVGVAFVLKGPSPGTSAKDTRKIK